MYNMGMKSKRYKKYKTDINNSLIAPELCNTYMITPQEAIFVAEYTRNWNEIDALKKAGLYPPKAKVPEARGITNKLLSKSAIVVAIQQASQYRVERILSSTDMVIAHLTRIATADMNQLLNEDGTVKQMHEIPYELRCCISEIKVRSKFRKDAEGDMVFDGYITEAKLENHTTALKELLRFHNPQLNVNLNQTNITQNNTSLSHIDTKEKIDTLLELLSGETKDEEIIDLEKIEECNLEQ